MTLKRVFLSENDQKLISETTGVKIQTKNYFKINQSKISELLDTAKQNALVYLERNKLGQKLSIFEENNLFKNILEIQSKLGLTNLPRRIECYDISHLSGKFVYGSMVVFIDGRPQKKFYRLFKCPDRNDDFLNHKEVLTRRFSKLFDEKYTNDPAWQLPNLMIIDGGIGQLNSDLEILQTFEKEFLMRNLHFGVEICSLAKKEEEVFLPNNSQSIKLNGSSLFLIQRIRDEAHRFAISNNQKARLKTAHKSKLDEINGIGPVSKEKLLKVFQSTENLINNLVSNEPLVVETVGKSITEKLKKYFGIVNF